MNATAEISQFSFKHALDCVPKNRQHEARQKIKEIFSITSDMQLYKRINGFIEPKVSKKEEIEKLFWSDFRIKVAWGKDTSSLV